MNDNKKWACDLCGEVMPESDLCFVKEFRDGAKVSRVCRSCLSFVKKPAEETKDASHEEHIEAYKNLMGGAKEEKMSNQPTKEGDGKRNTRKRLEEALETNLNLARGAWALSRQVSASLFGAKPEGESTKEGVKAEGSFFDIAGSMADEIGMCLNEAGDELRAIIKELK